MARIERTLLTQAEYARHRKAAGLPGGSREAVRKAVDEGRISTLDGGKIDPTVADIQWIQNTRTRLSPQAAARPPAPAPAHGTVSAESQVSAAELDLVAVAQAATPPTADAPPPAAPAPDSGYTAARARREAAEAEQAEIGLRKLRGDLVEWAAVARGGFEVGRDLRDTMASAENALAAELAPLGTAEQCAEVLRRHHRAVCEVLMRSWREKVGPQPEGMDG